MPLPDRPSWLRARSYVHFDPRVGLDFAAEYCEDPKRVASHSFYPFLRYEAVTRRYKRDAATGKRAITEKRRPICYGAHLDSHVLAKYAADLATLHEARLAEEACRDSVLAYRQLGKSNIDFAVDAFDNVRALAPCVALAYDIESFFDSLDHAKLKAAWCDSLGQSRLDAAHHHLFRSVTRYSWVDQSEIFELFGIDRRARRKGLSRICEPAEFREQVAKTGLIKVNAEARGIPQGSPISAVLSNLYMLPVDRTMSACASELGGTYRRYCDDILIVVPISARAQAEAALESAICERALKLQAAKTEVCTFYTSADGALMADRSLQYLGFTYDGTRVSLREATLARYYRRMKSAVRASARAARGNLEHPQLFRRALYERFSHLGGLNFVTYGKRAAIATDSPTVRRQVGRHWAKLNAEIKKREGS